MTLVDRIGFDAGGAKLEDSLETAIAHGFHYLDFSAECGPNRLDSWSPERANTVREICSRNDIHVSLHTSSGVNIAEVAPFVGDGVDQYLRGYVDLARLLDCHGVVVHGGYHFSSQLEARKTASVERLKRAVAYAEGQGVVLLLENLNFEPNDAEVHYLAHTVDECRLYFDAIPSAHLGWAFTVNHANLVPEGINGFLDAFGVDRIGEVRLADNLGDREVHLKPGQGNIDFQAMFSHLESSGYQKFYTMAFGSLEDKLEAREAFGEYRV
ncbi:MAG: hypothetical protein BZY88_14235 [SAR202 cluster bacterium Io17-Chloro-G9]|nr:MAG: hypothetical protein BZY88_14235 [SAR202 cluster bacterium Io17-Chloro-G9]